MTVTVERLGHLGDGIAAGPVFVPMALPGEVVAGEVVDGRIAAPKIVTPSTDRVRPVCRHFKTCGGCKLQHASDEFVSGWKASVVQAACDARGILAPIREVKTSPAQSRRRAAFSARRTKKGAIVGFHAGASDAIIEIPDCKLLHPDLVAMMPFLGELTVMAASRKAEVTYRATLSENGIDLAVDGGRELDVALRVALPGMAKKGGLARLTWDGELVAERLPPVQHFADVAVVPPPGSFLQATEHGERALLASVKQAIGAPKRILDLFSGCGTFALPLASGAEVHAVESDAAMLAALDKGWRQASGLKKVSTQARDLFARPLMPDELKGFEAVVIDPPRAGAEAQFEQIAASSVRHIAAVSCNPVTFARDAGVLIEAGFVVDWIDVIDQFRWSPHVELVAAIRRA
ncbi:MAG: RsmD family RNA methyltransferase [Marinosulfonomonas sp.]|nr:RsmD family RNA methyltransferase [Marinosulfonomonas sp.]